MPLDREHDSRVTAGATDRPTGAERAEDARGTTRDRELGWRETSDRLAATYRQWRTPGRRTDDVVAHVHTTLDAPDQLPHQALLGQRPAAIDEAWTAWDSAQLVAS
jgi:hypothetical protein